MKEVVITFLEQNLGTALTIVLIVIAIVIWGAYKLGQKKELLDSLPCKKHGEDLSKLSEETKQYTSDISEIKGSLNTLMRILSTDLKPYAPKKAGSYSKKKSPRMLNKNGLRIFKEVEGEKFIADNKSFLFAEMSSFMPKTAYDVEVAAFYALRINQGNDIFDGLKNWVYLAPVQKMENQDGTTYESEITLDDVLFIISIPLRDAYLKEHPELKPTTGDQH